MLLFERSQASEVNVTAKGSLQCCSNHAFVEPFHSIGIVDVFARRFGVFKYSSLLMPGLKLARRNHESHLDILKGLKKSSCYYTTQHSIKALFAQHLSIYNQQSKSINKIHKINTPNHYWNIISLAQFLPLQRKSKGIQSDGLNGNELRLLLFLNKLMYFLLILLMIIKLCYFVSVDEIFYTIILIQMCLGPAVIPPTQKAKNYVTFIRVLMALQALVVILNFVAAKQFLREAIFGIFFFFLLYVIQHQLSYQAIMIFIFISIFFTINFLVFFLTPLQNQKDLNILSNMDKYIYADAVFSFVYYLFCAIACFYPYREFKAIEYNNNPALKNYFQHQQQQERPPNTAANPTKTVNYDINYGNITYDQKKRNNDNGAFQVFKGQGVKIG